MKAIKYLLINILAIFVISCESGIDPITPVNPGPDESAPEVQINYPLEGTLIRVREDITSIAIRTEVTDDIEIKSVSISIDDNVIGTFSDFKDYRRAVLSYNYENLTNGEHTLSVTANDLSGKTTTKSVNFEKVAPYVPKFDGEIFYMPFDGDNLELVTINYAKIVGSPTFADGKIQKAYKGATDSYLTFPTKDESLGIDLLNADFSVSFWYKVNPVPDRGGIIVIGPETEGAAADKQNNRTAGIRLFRENVGGKQRIKANVGNGTTDGWIDNALADLDPTNPQWVYLTLTINPGKAVLYVNGVEAGTNALTAISWNGCDILSIGSGAPRFTEWSHLSDLSLIDELRLFNKALSPAEIQAIMTSE